MDVLVVVGVGVLVRVEVLVAVAVIAGVLVGVDVDVALRVGVLVEAEVGFAVLVVRVGVDVRVEVGLGLATVPVGPIVALITVPTSRGDVVVGVDVKVGTMPIGGEGVAMPFGVGRARLGVGGCSAMTEVGLIRPDLGGIWKINSSIKPPKTKKLRMPRATMTSTHDSGVSFLIACRVWIFLFYSSPGVGALERKSARSISANLSRILR